MYLLTCVLHTVYYVGMRVDIWIRKENQAEWDAIGEKSLWVNQRLEEKRAGREFFSTPMPSKEKYQQEYPTAQQMADELVRTVNVPIPEPPEPTDERYKYDPSIGEWFDFEIDAYVGTHLPN